MAKKQVAAQTYGPYFETYIKIDRATGDEWEQEVPAYREVQTQYGVFGVPAGRTLSFSVVEDPEKGPLVTPIYSDKVVKAKKAVLVKPPAAPKPAADKE